MIIEFYNYVSDNFVGQCGYQINNGCPMTVPNKLTMLFVSLNPTATHPAAIPSM